MKAGTVHIIGRPNSGKSTLINALVGQKVSITSRNPQTTRHRILGILTEPRGQIIFSDTPGIHKPRYRMNTRMVRRAVENMGNSDLVMLVIDGSASFGAGEEYAIEILRGAGPDAFLLINKIDRIAKATLLPIIGRYSEKYKFLEILPISALKGDNLTLLIELIFKYLPQSNGLFDPEQYTDRTERFLTAEFIREKILDRTREEVPYATAVIVRMFDETRRAKKRLVMIDADILVEKKSQQGIILGTRGSLIKNIGIAARRDLEQLLDCRVYLTLRVKAVRKWRNNDQVLNDLEV